MSYKLTQEVNVKFVVARHKMSLNVTIWMPQLQQYQVKDKVTKMKLPAILEHVTD
jgi:hypothetical protein